jgi:hypothetical protein
MSLTVTQAPDRTPVRPVRVVSMEERRAGLANVAAQLEEAWERGYAECARRYNLPQAAGRPRHLSAVPAGSAS